MPTKLLSLIFLIALCSATAGAATVIIDCTPAGTEATASFHTELALQTTPAGIFGSGALDLTLQSAGGTAPMNQDGVQVRGQVQIAQDSAHQNATYQVLFGSPVFVSPIVTYARIAIGDPSQGSINSYIRDLKGVYYYSHCKNQTQSADLFKTRPE
jgi:hypothetical protein